MNVPILNIGGFLAQDASGRLVNECSVEKISPPWREAVEEVRRLYLERHPGQIHSLYLRGSLPRGLAVTGVSDVDTFAVLKDEAEGYDFSWVRRAGKDLRRKHPFVSNFEFFFLRRKDLMEASDHFSYRFVLKTLSVCLFGEDLAASIPPFKPGLKLAIALHGNLENEIERALTVFRASPHPRERMETCRWIMKRWLRGGAAMLMDTEKVYTRDLLPCSEIFAKHYPRHEAQIREGLSLAVAPVSDPDRLTAFLTEVRTWFIPELHRRLYGVRPNP